MNNTQKRVAIYIRVSTLDQAQEGYSLAAQEKVLRTWAQERQYRVVDVYADAGISGKDMTHRPEVNRMLHDVQSGTVDVVAIWALSRLTRSVADLYNILSVMNRHGADLYSHTESFDTSTPVGRAMIGILGVFAQMEREVTGERVRAAMSERAASGKCTCSEVLGYDKAGDSLKINEEEACVVQYIFMAYAMFKNLSTVASLCQKRGYTGKRGRTQEAESIKKILTRPIYAGYYTYNGLLFKGDFQPIIPVKTFNTIQKIVYKNARKAKMILLPE